MIILDTNVVSELMKKSCSLPVAQWIRQHSIAGLYLTSVTVAEIQYGISCLAKSARRDRLAHEANEIFSTFSEYILDFNSQAVHRYGHLAANRKSMGHPISIFDAQIAAIALENNAEIATRNTKNFVGIELKIINPWGE
jgi:toxin FitB